MNNIKMISGYVIRIGAKRIVLVLLASTIGFILWPGLMLTFFWPCAGGEEKTAMGVSTVLVTAMTCFIIASAIHLTAVEWRRSVAALRPSELRTGDSVRLSDDGEKKLNLHAIGEIVWSGRGRSQTYVVKFPGLDPMEFNPQDLVKA